MIERGDWIEIVNLNKEVDGAICYVLKTRTFSDDGFQELLISAVRHKNKPGETFTGVKWIEWIHCRKLSDELVEKDFDTLIDWALDNNDKEYFMELTNRKTMLQKF